jgi:hypothetical protein
MRCALTCELLAEFSGSTTSHLFSIDFKFVSQLLKAEDSYISVVRPSHRLA